jgi:pimeloyl-ACP methyl ester carboxylesterase
VEGRFLREKMSRRPRHPGLHDAGGGEIPHRLIEVRGVPTFLYDAGEGPPVLLIHGYGDTADSWRRVVPRLLARHRVIALDVPPFGRSGDPDLPQLLDFYKEFFPELFERLEIDSATVIGHSLGGAIALRRAIRRPELVRAVVLAGAAGISSATRAARYALTITGILKPGRRIAPHRGRVARSPLLRRVVFGRWGASDPPALPAEVVDAVLAGPARHTDTVSAAKALVRDDLRLDLERVTCPTLVLWGARDNQLPVGDAFEYARRLRAPLRVIADCGHLLIGERPEVCAGAALEFFAAR